LIEGARRCSSSMYIRVCLVQTFESTYFQK
jgi:hypothetical protein